MMAWVALPAALLLTALCATSCGQRDIISGDIKLECPGFEVGSVLPKRYAYEPEGKNVSPALTWSGLPEGTKELVIIVEDPFPHAKIFVHWVMYGIPPTVGGVAEGFPPDEPKAGGFTQGTNDFGHLGWGGPLPRAGQPPHRYSFWIYAVDMNLNLAPGATKDEVLAAMSKGRHILANGRVIGVYPR